MKCNRCGKWAGAHATLPGQPTDHLCMCQTMPAPDTEELRLVIAHYKTALRLAATMARNSVRTNSRDIEDWREDMQVLADSLERQIDA